MKSKVKWDRRVSAAAEFFESPVVCGCTLELLELDPDDADEEPREPGCEFGATYARIYATSQ